MKSSECSKCDKAINSLINSLITFHCTRGDVHTGDNAGSASTSTEENFLLQAAGGPLVKLLRVKLKAQAGL